MLSKSDSCFSELQISTNVTCEVKDKEKQKIVKMDLYVQTD